MKHKYRKTVLDATDEQGQPFLNHPDITCPFHFMNEDFHKANVQFVEGYSVNQVLCMTFKSVKKGSELFVYYGKDVNRSHWLSLHLPLDENPPNDLVNATNAINESREVNESHTVNK